MHDVTRKPPIQVIGYLISFKFFQLLFVHVSETMFTGWLKGQYVARKLFFRKGSPRKQYFQG